MSELVNPHGSKNLKPLLVYGIERRELLNKAKQLKKIKMSSREISDLLMYF